MFEIMLVMLAVAVQTADRAASMPNSGASAAVAAPVVEDKAAKAQDSAAEAVAPPSFLAPAGPKLVAEPQEPRGKFTTALEVKPILNATRGSWIAVREFNGQDLVYVTQVWSWRCGLVELRIGINGAAPEPWPLPVCHEDQAVPNAILESDGVPYRAFPLGSVSQVEVRITFDDLDTGTAKFNRQGVLIP